MKCPLCKKKFIIGLSPKSKKMVIELSKNGMTSSSIMKKLESMNIYTDETSVKWAIRQDKLRKERIKNAKAKLSQDGEILLR